MASAPRDPVSYAILSEDALPTWKRIILETCNKHDVSYNDIMSPRRAVPIVRAGQETMAAEDGNINELSRHWPQARGQGPHDNFAWCAEARGEIAQ